MIIKETFLRELADALVSIIGDGRYADRILQKKLKENKQWASEERSLFAKTTYDVLRNWRRLWYSIGDDPAPEIPRVVKALCSWFLMNGFKIQRSPALPNLDTGVLRKRWLEADEYRAIKYSIPDWLDKLGEKELGAMWSKTIDGLHHEAVISVRVNTLKANRTELKEQFRSLGLHTNTSSLSADGLKFSEFANVFATDAFKKGWFEVQDIGSQCIAPFIQPEPGMRVVDACAGSGGKSLHLAALMNNKGKVIALDTEEWKLNDLTKRAARAGAHIIETRHISSTKVVKRLQETADRVLLDVPCSGLGVLRRNPDTKWHLQPTDLSTFVTTQRDILTRYSSMVNATGKLVYATCSILPSEGEDQVQWFIENNPQWQLEEERRILPHRDNCDGFYMARLSKIVHT